ncbi:hypothetical protein BKA70DRAFT_598734 [Coprinopsis sp. MPI-PUGE-AT-0042]|nr:hypothetical protein BKA70DRAFT_598734 [Coprinopsis sp. MPI-PUGE-AT-0042]
MVLAGTAPRAHALYSSSLLRPPQRLRMPLKRGGLHTKPCKDFRSLNATSSTVKYTGNTDPGLRLVNITHHRIHAVEAGSATLPRATPESSLPTGTKPAAAPAADRARKPHSLNSSSRIPGKPLGARPKRSGPATFQRPAQDAARSSARAPVEAEAKHDSIPHYFQRECR